MKAVGATMLVAGMIGAVPVTAANAQTSDDVVIVYDASGSMWGQIDGVSKMEIARNVLGDLVTTWPEKANIGLMAYGHRSKADCSDIETVIAPAPLDRAAFVRAVENITPRGRTPLTESIRQAAELLSFRDRKATVILISDGVETCQADPCALSAELARQGVKFTAHVVGFDLSEEKHAGLACIAENTGGVFVPANNADGLKEALAHVQKVMDLKPMAQAEPLQPDLIDIALEAPSQVTTGAPFRVSWSSSVHPRDYVTIVPTGAEEGSHTSYQRVKDNTEDRLVAPPEPGLYEVRYVLNEGGRTLASTPVEVVEAEVDISAPSQVTTGAPFKVSWSSSVHPRDYVTIVPTGAEEGSHTSYQRVKDNTEDRLVAPAEPGLYEVRYVLNEGGRTLASASVEVVEAEVVVNGPDIARTKTPVRVTWSVSIHPRDYITIVSAGAKEGTHQDYLRVGEGVEGELKAPAEPGLYEIRYVLQEGQRTLARKGLEVVNSNAPLDDGAGLTVPSQASTGETISISWTGGSDSPDQRISLARADQADFSWIAAHSIGDKTSMQLTMPDEPGRYELRYLDVTGRAVLGRSIVEVE